jgi:hypothetical protein
MKSDANVFWLALAGLFGLGGARLYLRRRERLSAKPPADEKKGEASSPIRTKHVAAYRLPSGDLSYSRRDAVIVAPGEVKDKAVTLLNRMTQPQLSPGAFVGVAERETGFAINEEDFDYYMTAVCAAIRMEFFKVISRMQHLRYHPHWMNLLRRS